MAGSWIKKTSVFKRFRDKYHLKILNDTTFEEVVSFKLSRMNVFVVLTILSILIITLVTIIIAFTPLREFIPGYPDGSLRKNITNNLLRLDSLENELRLRDQYIENIKNIIEGKVSNADEHNADSTANVNVNDFQRSKDDSDLRSRVEGEEAFNVTNYTEKSNESSLSNVHFFPPVKGIVTAKFEIANNHYGTDIVAATGTIINSIYDGTVIASNWTVDFGYVIQIQHANNLISVYKHNSELLKNIGDHVTAGEPVAIIGNTGELSTGPHLHFEMWYKGTPLDSELYINY